MPRLRVIHRDDAVFGDLAGDSPPPLGSVTAPGGLDVLPGNQRQQTHCRGSVLIQLPAFQRLNQRIGITHQGRDQRIPGGRIVPVDHRLAG